MSRACQITLTCCFLAIVFVVPLSQAAVEIYDGTWPQLVDFFTRAPTRDNLRAFEKELEASSLYSRALRPWVQLFWFATLRNPWEKAVVGRDGWLFYKPDVRYLVEPCRFSEDPVPAILAFRDQLQRRGIRLLVLPIPGKPSVYADQLTRRANGKVQSTHSCTGELILRLRKAGVETLDLFDALLRLRKKSNPGQLAYLVRDTHWSCLASRIAAEVVGQRLRELGWVQRGPAEYELKPVAVKRRGDIVRMINVPELETQFPPEEIPCEQVVENGSGQPYKDDPRSPVLILGDSFLRTYQTDEPLSSGFIAHLARELQMPVASIVNDGGASTLVRQELRRKAGLLDGKQVVIWEFVERDIRFGTEGWKYVALPE